MLKEHLHLSRAKHETDQLYLWWRAPLWLIPTLFVVTTLLMGALCMSGQTNEPVWPAPLSLQLNLAHLL